MRKGISRVLIGSVIGGFALAISATCVSLWNTSKAQEAKAAAVTFSDVAWNNIDYSSGAIGVPNLVNYVPQSGYLALLRFSDLFNPVGTENIAYTNPEYTSHIKINGISINQLSGSICRIYSGHLFVYFDDSEVQYTDDYYRPTIEIDANTTFYSNILPYVRVEYKSAIGKQNGWVDVTNATKTNVTYSAIAWNNTDYGYMDGKKGLLLSYSDNLSSSSNELNGGVKSKNFNKTTFAQNVLLNGTPFSEIEGAEISYYAQTYLWLYTPTMTAAVSNGYPKIEILGESFFDVVIPSSNLYFVGSSWSDTIQEASFVEIAWNNTDWSNVGPNIENYIPTQGYCLLLKYDRDLGTASSTNLATSSYDAGNHIKINGIAAKDISGALICLYPFTNMLYIYFPDASLSYSGSYYRPTVEIETCLINNYLIPEMAFEFTGILGQGNKWVILDNKSFPVDSFSGISWNNTDYGYMDGKKGILLSFENYLSNSSSEVNGSIKTRNYKNTLLGRNILINGISLSTKNNAEVAYYAQNHLWIYAPDMTEASNGYSVPHLTISAPTAFLDVTLPSLHFNFINNQWTLDENIYYQYASYVSMFDGYNNKDMGNGYKDNILVFDKMLSTSGETNLISTNAEFVNKVTLNGTPLKDVPGIYVIYMGNNYVHMMIRTVDLAPTAEHPITKLSIPQDTLLFNYRLNSVDLFLNSTDGEWASLDDCLITTDTHASFSLYKGLVNTAGLTFTHRINKDIYDDLLASNNSNDITIGSYIVPKENYLNSSYSSVISYIENNVAGSSTYANIVNTKKDFANQATASADGYYQFNTSMYNLKESHYADGYIGVGYVKVGDRTYYGNKTDESTTFYELMVDAYHQSIIDNRYFASIASFQTTNNSFELIDDSVYSNHNAISFASKGYYQMTATHNIRTIVIDGVPYKANISQNSSTYFSYYNGTVDFKTSVEMVKGIGEPMYEIFPDNTNSNADLNTPDNVSTLNQLFGSNAERIWLDVRCGLSSNTALGINATNSATGEFDFDEQKVADLHAILKKFTDKGITNLTCFLSGWVQSYDAPLFYKNGTWYSFNEALSVEGAAYCNIIPAQTNESYQKWLDVNEQLAYKIAMEFPEFTSIEALNEIDGGGYQYDPNYVSSSTITNINTLAGWAMDYTHALSKGVRRAHSNMKVMTPALSCLDVSTGHYYNSKAFLNACYSHIENSSDPCVNNWFQVVNLHPYVFPTKANVGDDSVYLFNERPNKNNPSSIDNSDYDTDWINYVNYFHNTIMANHSDAKKAIAITELGLSDMSGTTDNYWKYMNYNNRLNTVANKVFTKIDTINYIDTLIWFRLFDFSTNGATAAFACLEPNFGMIEENKTLKELGKVVYQYWNNGSTNYTPINNYLSTMVGRE